MPIQTQCASNFISCQSASISVQTLIPRQKWQSPFCALNWHLCKLSSASTVGFSLICVHFTTESAWHQNCVFTMQTWLNLVVDFGLVLKQTYFIFSTWMRFNFLLNQVLKQFWIDSKRILVNHNKLKLKVL